MSLVPASQRSVLAEIQAVKDLIAPGAADAELSVYARVCADLALSPFAGEICLIGRYDKTLRRKVYKHQITVAGRRAIANRTGRLRGIEGPVWCGPRVHTKTCTCAGRGFLAGLDGELVRCHAGELVWHEVWDDNDQPPYCARTLVHVEGWDIPVNGTAKWSEFCQYVSGDAEEARLAPLWQRMPSHMLGKVSESLALRRAIPEVEQALAYAQEWPVNVGAEADDAALIAEAEAQSQEVAADPPPTSVAAGPVPAPAASPLRREPAPARPRRDQPRRAASGSWDKVPDSVYDDLPEANR